MNTTRQPTTPSLVSSTSSSTAHLGLDVSKDTLDACLLMADKRHEKQFANNPVGHRQLLRWAHSLAKETPCHFCLEATGPYLLACCCRLSRPKNLPDKVAFGFCVTLTILCIR